MTKKEATGGSGKRMALNLGFCVVISLAMVSLLTLLLSALIFPTNWIFR